MRALITGAGGFVGRWLAAELLEAGHQVYGLVRPNGSQPVQGVTALPADIHDVGAIRQALGAAKPDAIYHLAALSSGASRDREALWEVNVYGTRRLVDAAAALGHPVRIVLASTGYVYGDCDPNAPATEDSPASPVGPYAESKWAMECAAREAARPPVTLLIARAFNHTGPGQRPDFSIPSFARQIARAERAGSAATVSVGDLSPLRDFLDVRDIARAYRLFVEKGEHGAVINVASGIARSMEEILTLLCQQARVPARILQDTARARAVDIRANVGSAVRLRELTGWHPSREIHQTLEDVLDYWRGQAEA